MAGAVLAAFSFEGYLNHVGAMLFDSWTEERAGLESLSWQSKLALIAEQLGIPLERGALPYQALPELFRFRNELAHGKTRTAKLTGVPLDDLAVNLATLEWEKWCNAERVGGWLNAVKLMVERIHSVFWTHPKVPQSSTTLEIVKSLTSLRIPSPLEFTA